MEQLKHSVLDDDQCRMLTHFRREELHKYPELSGEETRTSKKIAEFLSRYAPDEVISDLGGTGIAAIYKGQDPGPTILVRCELDALPIDEESDLAYKSSYEGVAHVCGHDGHMTMVAGLAPLFDTSRPPKGRVVLLFQPAEENGHGAKAILEDPKFEKIRPDFVFALHNLPGYPLHQVVIRRDTFTASVTSMIAKFKGKTSHAGEPENGINPAPAIARSLQAALAHHHNVPESDAFTVITPVYMTMGEKAYGVSAGKGELHLTLRCWTTERLKKLCAEIEEEIATIAEDENLQFRISYTQEFEANVNNPDALEYVTSAAKTLGLSLVERDFPFKWGEDFGQFTGRFPGVMFGVGAGKETPALHNPDYDFPDSLIPTGTGMFYHIIHEVLDGSK